jgi:enoyl-CoA hydratase/carnithine racemase
VSQSRSSTGSLTSGWARPDKRNAIDTAMFAGLVTAGERLKSEPGVRAVVLSGEGPDFCAGLDFGMFQALGDGERLSTRVELSPSQGPARAVSQRAAYVWTEVPVPVSAAITGNALGGGLQIALGADIRIVAPDAKLSVLEIRWGLVPRLLDLAGRVDLETGFAAEQEEISALAGSPNQAEAIAAEFERRPPRFADPG